MSLRANHNNQNKISKEQLCQIQARIYAKMATFKFHVESKIVQPFGNVAWHFLTKLNTYIIFDPTIVFGIFPRKMKTFIDTKTCKHIFISVLLHITKKRNKTNVLPGRA
jgi:hypothetical protein